MMAKKKIPHNTQEQEAEELLSIGLKVRDSADDLRREQKPPVSSAGAAGAAGDAAFIESAALVGLFKPETLSRSYTSNALTALSFARTRGEVVTDEVTHRSTLTVGEVKIVSNRAAKLSGIGEQKLLDLGRSGFTRLNPPHAKTPQLRVFADTKEFARACNAPIDPKTMKTPEAQAKENKRAEKALENFIAKYGKCGDNLRENASFSWQEKVGGRIIAHDGVNLVTRCRIDKDVTMIEFSLSAAEYMVRQPITTLHRALYALDDRSYNAFAIGRAISEYYGMDSNVIRNKESILKVETLLAKTSLSFEKLGSRYRSRWEARIKEPFEEALDELYRIGFLKTWRYSLSGKADLSDEEAAHIIRYEQFASLYVCFEIADYPTHGERLKEIADRREKAAKRKSRSRKKTEPEAGSNP